jgi:epoxyqueuosine reductase
MSLIGWTLENHNIEHWGMTPLQTPISLHFYKNWIEKNYHGEMAYLKEHLPQKENPQLLLPQAQNAIVMTFPYGLKKNKLATPNLQIASYAQDEDYHLWLKQKVQKICQDLKSLYPEFHFLGFTDSAPVLERDLAYRAGLGWIGKNTCLIDRKRGSLFFIAEIYTDLPNENPSPLPLVPDHCGTCDRCIKACPTQAIEEDRTLNATKCISYWTIESKKIPPPELRDHFSGWFFGCDICQTVCPWNIKVRDLNSRRPEDPSAIEKELRLILESSNKQLLRIFAGSPLIRAGGKGLKRNALIVIANLKIHNLKKVVASYFEDSHLNELAHWTYQKLE